MSGRLWLAFCHFPFAFCLATTIFNRAARLRTADSLLFICAAISAALVPDEARTRMRSSSYGVQTRPADFISPSPSAPVFRSFRARGKFNFYLNARKVAARGIRLWLQLRYRAQEFCMTYVPGAPIASPGDSLGSGEPFSCRERQPRHRKSENPDNSGS